MHPHCTNLKYLEKCDSRIELFIVNSWNSWKIIHSDRWCSGETLLSKNRKLKVYFSKFLQILDHGWSDAFIRLYFSITELRPLNLPLRLFSHFHVCMQRFNSLTLNPLAIHVSYNLLKIWIYPNESIFFRIIFCSRCRQVNEYRRMNAWRNSSAKLNFRFKYAQIYFSGIALNELESCDCSWNFSLIFYLFENLLNAKINDEMNNYHN